MPDVAAPADDLTLTLDGQVYRGWTGISVLRGIDSLTGAFRLDLATRELTGGAIWPLRAGATVQVHIDGDLLLTGYTDRLDANLGANDHVISLSGRDKAADLIDCSAMNTPGSWRNAKIDVIVRDLLAPFGLTLEVTADTGAPVARFALQQGESAFAAIERLCRYRGLLCYSLANGTVRIGSPGKGAVVANLVEGVNILEASAAHDVSERFSDYLVKGQASGNDANNGPKITSASAKAKDAGVGRYRPLLIVGEEQSDIASLKRRAEWEANVRAAKSQPANVTVVGWRRADGALWAPDNKVRLNCPSIYINSDMLVASVELLRDNSGTVTRLSLERPEAYAQLPVSEKADASAIGAA